MTAEVLNNAVTDECLRMYKSLGFLRLPRYPMLVDGTMIDFMVDSRGARSTIRPCDLPCEARMTVWRGGRGKAERARGRAGSETSGESVGK